MAIAAALSTSLAVSLLVNLSMCVHAVLMRTEAFFDLTGSFTFLLLAHLTAAPGKLQGIDPPSEAQLAEFFHGWDFGLFSAASPVIAAIAPVTGFLGAAFSAVARAFGAAAGALAGGAGAGSAEGSFVHAVPLWLVTAWALRLGAFLFWRVTSRGEDKRFKRAKASIRVMFTFWTVQALWVVIVLCPVIALHADYADRTAAAGNGLGAVPSPAFAASIAVAVLGLATEWIADFQRTQHRNNPANKGTFIQSGLWSISRHPNYAGEILFWTGIGAAAFTVLAAPFLGSVADNASAVAGRFLVCAISPVFTAFLLIRVSGIPILERTDAKRYGDAYTKYKASTACLYPGIW